MSTTVFRVSAGFLVGVLALLALALYLADYYTQEHQRLAAAGDARGASEAARVAIRLDPFDTDALEARAITLQQRRDYGGAVASLREAIERDPNNYLPYLILANTQSAREDLDAAAKNYRAVLELNPKASVASAYLAQTLTRQGELEEAKRTYLPLEKEGRISYEGLYDLGRIEVRTGEAEEGVRDISRARRQASRGIEELEPPLRGQRQRFVNSMDLALADALVVAGREGRARGLLSGSPSRQAPSLLELLNSDPQAYREQVVNSAIY